MVPGPDARLRARAVTFLIARKRRYPVHEAVPRRELMRSASQAIWALMMPFVILFGVTAAS